MEMIYNKPVSKNELRWVLKHDNEIQISIHQNNVHPRGKAILINRLTKKLQPALRKIEKVYHSEIYARPTNPLSILFIRESSEPDNYTYSGTTMWMDDRSPLVCTLTQTAYLISRMI